MPEINPVIKKLQLKDQSKPVLILNAPEEYNEVINAFEAEVHTTEKEEEYHFVQVFGTTMAELKVLAHKAASVIKEDGLLWVCYPKKSSKKYKASDCNRDDLVNMLGDEDFEAVRLVAIDADWSAMRFKSVNNIKSLTRSKAATSKGKERIKDNK